MASPGAPKGRKARPRNQTTNPDAGTRCSFCLGGGIKQRVVLLCFVSLLFAVINGLFMAHRSQEWSQEAISSFRFFWGPEGARAVSTTADGRPGEDTHPEDPVSRHLQVTAKQAAKKAVAQRVKKGEVCVTTLDRSRLPENERGLLLFSAPAPLTEFPSSLQSWDDALRGKGRLVIITNDPLTRKICAENEVPTVCVEHTDEGLPRLDKMFERMHNSQPQGIVAYVNSDLTVENFDPMYDFLQEMQDNPLELQHTTKTYEPFEASGILGDFWFVVATRIDILANGSRERHTVGGYDFWAWNTEPEGPPLLPFDFPPFRFPFATYDNWLLDVLVQSGERNAVDASVVIDILHHDHKRVGDTSNWSQALRTGKSGVYINRYLAFKEPTASLEAKGDLKSQYLGVKYYLQHGTPVGCPYYAIKDAFSGRLTIAKRKFFSNLPEDDPAQKKCIGRQKCPQRRFIRTKTRQEEANMAMLPFADGIKATSSIMESAEQNWRYTMEEQLKQHATAEGFVLLTAVNYAYRDHIMNFKCTLERVGMTDHFVVAAMDEKMYKWGILQGLPIFLASSAKDDSKSLTSSGGKYGSGGFQKVTKLKSRAVLEVLNAGYSVVWSDVDIMWFVHPFDALAGFMKRDSGIAIQSNAPYKQNRKRARPHKTVAFVKSDDPAGYRRLNSGLYVAPNNDLVRSAFQEIVDHAAESDLTEQPSFDEILCSRYPSERRYASCTYRPEIKDTTERWFGATMSLLARHYWDVKEEGPTSMHVELLDRFMFPNGAVLVGPKNENVYVHGEKSFSKITRTPLYAAHNNWILGEDWKKKRAESAGWWFTDSNNTCAYPVNAKQ